MEEKRAIGGDKKSEEFKKSTSIESKAKGSSYVSRF
jgi:hypothetical protein